MITELDTDEELSQTSNLTQDDDLTFDLTSGTTSNDNIQTQPVPNTSQSTTQPEHKTNTRRNKCPSFSQQSPAKAIRSSSKSTSVPLTTDQQHSKK